LSTTSQDERVAYDYCATSNIVLIIRLSAAGLIRHVGMIPRTGGGSFP